VRLVAITLCSALFFANFAHKAGYYNAHLVTWYSLCASVLVCDFWDWVKRAGPGMLRNPRVVKAASITVLTVVSSVYGALLTLQYIRYHREARNPDLAWFSDLRGVLRSVIPSDLCPVAVKAPVFWLAFTEKDECFATIERRMAGAVDIAGKEYALITRPKSPEYWARDLYQSSHLLGEISDTPYGSFSIYYTGADPRRFRMEPKRYYFFQRWRGYVTGEQVARAQAVWREGSVTLSLRPDSSAPAFSLHRVCSLDLRAGVAYQISFDVSQSAGPFDPVVTDKTTGASLKEINVDATAADQCVDGLFRTLSSGAVNVGIRGMDPARTDQVRLTTLVIREVGEL
jgi:hypothetical protein